MASFIDKLRLDNLYPTVPIHTGPDDLFNRFLAMQQPMINQNRLQQIGQQALVQTPLLTSQLPTDGRPGNASPNVIYRPPVTDQIGANILGVEADPASVYQKGQLALRQKELERKAAEDAASNDLNKKKVDISQQRANVYKFKAENPGYEYKMNKATGHLEAINPINNSVQDLGQYQMNESDLAELNQKNALGKIASTGEEARKTEETRQKGRETLAEMAARHKEEQAALEAKLKGSGTIRTETLIKDAEGTTTGKTTTTKPNASTIMMYGPQGQGPYPIPLDKVQDAIKNKQMSTTKPKAK